MTVMRLGVEIDGDALNASLARVVGIDATVAGSGVGAVVAASQKAKPEIVAGTETEFVLAVPVSDSFGEFAA